MCSTLDTKAKERGVAILVKAIKGLSNGVILPFPNPPLLVIRAQTKGSFLRVAEIM